MVLDFIESYVKENGYPPNKDEIAKHLNLSGTDLYRLLNELRGKKLEWRTNRQRSIFLLTKLTPKAGKLLWSMYDGYNIIDLYRWRDWAIRIAKGKAKPKDVIAAISCAGEEFLP